MSTPERMTPEAALEVMRGVAEDYEYRDGYEEIVQALATLSTLAALAQRVESQAEQLGEARMKADAALQYAEIQKARADALEKDAGRWPQLLQELQELAARWRDEAAADDQRAAEHRMKGDRDLSILRMGYATLGRECADELERLITHTEADDHGR